MSSAAMVGWDVDRRRIVERIGFDIMVVRVLFLFEARQQQQLGSTDATIGIGI
jgi:hypothetical protein